jgi:hypothetical protein
LLLSCKIERLIWIFYKIVVVTTDLPFKRLFAISKFMEKK